MPTRSIPLALPLRRRPKGIFPSGCFRAAISEEKSEERREPEDGSRLTIVHREQGPVTYYENEQHMIDHKVYTEASSTVKGRAMSPMATAFHASSS